MARIDNPQAREAVNQLIQLGDEDDRIAATVFPLVDANKLDEAKRAVAIPRVAKLESSRMGTNKVLETRLNEILQEARNAKQSQFLVIVLGTLVTLAATLARGLWVAALAVPIRRQLPKVVKAAEQIAALEAERAEEYGAGFSVVAREIRRLADQTAVATLELEQMIKEMQSAVSIGVAEMAKFTKSVVHSVEDGDQLSDQIAEVIQQVQGLTPRFEQVSQSVDEQSQGAQQISEAMEHLSQASQQTAGSLRETNQALEQLDEATHSLKTEIARFKVTA